ncbi:MAG: hypothetical protein KC422_19915 [Trueperaceae bacterium]|nr:hypothetical protein [Trueperaceae bacterium]
MLYKALGISIGFVLWTALWLGSNAITQQLLPGWYSGERLSYLIFALSKTVAFSLLAGFLCFRLTKSMQALGILCLVQFSVGLLVTVLYFESAPLGYHLSFLLLLIPAHSVGAILAKPRQNSLY